MQDEAERYEEAPDAARRRRDATDGGSGSESTGEGDEPDISPERARGSRTDDERAAEGDAGGGRWQRIVSGEEDLSPSGPRLEREDVRAKADAASDAEAPEPEEEVEEEEAERGYEWQSLIGLEADEAGTTASDAGAAARWASEPGAGEAVGEAEEPPARPESGPADGRGVAEPADRRRETASRTTPSWADPVETGIEGLREEARRMAREDAEVNVPALDGDGRGSESERQIRERCLAFFETWKSRQRKRARDGIAKTEEAIAETLGQASLAVDKLERLTSELVRLKARVRLRRKEISDELQEQAEGGSTGLGTRIYVSAITFLGLVEFFANAPVFSSLLPRDPLTEQQIQLVSETSQGWLAGAERVFAHIILRPDAALLAAGVVTFLCVLAHFFGHSLRDLVIKHDREVRKEAVSSRSPLENVVPMVLTGLGLALVLGVLYEARVTLGEVGERQYNQDMAVVEELRREAEFLRSDGDLLEANQRVSRADDMEAAATDLLEYSRSMSRMSFPILLLNITLVLCAMSAAYFHRRDSRGDYFTEQPFESERKELIEQAEAVAEQVSGRLSDAVRGIRELRSKASTRPLEEWRSVVAQLESVVSLYRSENGRARGVDPGSIPAFGEPVRLDVTVEDESAAEYAADPDGYRRDHDRLAERFSNVRRRFNEQVLEEETAA